MVLVSRPPQQQRSRESLEKIMKAGLRVLSSQGMDGFTIAAVAKSAGIGTTAIYRRFENKDELLYALFHRFNDGMMADWLPAYRALSKADLDLESLVRGLVSELANALHKHETLLRVFVIATFTDPRLVTATNREVRSTAIEFEEALLAHRDEFKCAEPEIVVAACFQSVLDSFLRLVLFGEQAHPELDWDRLTEEMSVMVLAYLRVRRD